MTNPVQGFTQTIITPEQHNKMVEIKEAVEEYVGLLNSGYRDQHSPFFAYNVNKYKPLFRKPVDVWEPKSGSEMITIRIENIPPKLTGLPISLFGFYEYWDTINTVPWTTTIDNFKALCLAISLSNKQHNVTAFLDSSATEVYNAIFGYI